MRWPHSIPRRLSTRLLRPPPRQHSITRRQPGTLRKKQERLRRSKRLTPQLMPHGLNLSKSSTLSKPHSKRRKLSLSTGTRRSSGQRVWKNGKRWIRDSGPRKRFSMQPRQQITPRRPPSKLKMLASNKESRLLPPRPPLPPRRPHTKKERPRWPPPRPR